MTSISKPTLTSLITQEQFQSFYWLKKELITFCAQQNLPTSGSKNELTKRINTFLKTGKAYKSKAVKSIGRRDSEQIITRSTLVKNYKNDTKTRDFFIAQIGSHFRFNGYLRQFTNPDNISTNLTYGNLVDGWIIEEAKKKASPDKRQIGKQFEYNQFIRDYFTHETGKSLSDAIKAWKEVSTVDGPNTYIFFKNSLITNK